MSTHGTVFEFSAGGRAGGAEVLVVPLITKPKPALQSLAHADKLCGDALGRLVETDALGDEPGATAHTVSSAGVRRVLAVSLGDAAKLSPDRVRSAAAAVARWLMSERIKTAALWIDVLAGTSLSGAVGEWATGMALAGFRYATFRKPEKAPPARVKITLQSSQAASSSNVMPQVRSAQTLADAVNYTRSLAHQPPNVLHPAALAAEARRLASQCKLKLTIVDARQAQRRGMGGLLSVGMGAKHPPCLLHLEYRGAPRSRTNYVLVGKAITFDTGGYSIKPAAGMESMKFDKCGGMTVLGVLRAAATLKLRCNVTGIVAAAENAISENAYRPSDIITMMNGKTVEIISTDAEGRMVLGDALWYAQRECAPTAMIDLATLTGGVVVALGKTCAGLMGNDESLSDELLECGRQTHERLWPLPLWDDYRELIKGGDSDLRNSSGKRFAHPIVGGIFLKEFVEDRVPWAHLDIAGPATTDDDRNATGFGVRLLVQYLRRRETAGGA